MSKAPFIPILLFIFALLMGIIVQVFISAQYTILNADFYLDNLDKHHVYDIPQNYAVLKITSGQEKSADFINKQQIKAVNTAFSSEWTREQSSHIINNLLDFIKIDGQEPDLKLDFAARKTIFRNELIENLADLKKDELAAYGIRDQNIGAFADGIVEKLGLPDKLDLGPVICSSCDSQTNKSINTFRQYYKYSGYFIYMMYALAFALLLIISRTSGLKWFGISIIAAAILVVFCASLADNYANHFILTNISEQEKILATIGTNPVLLATLFKNSIVITMEKISLLFGSAGIILWIIGFYGEKGVLQKSNCLNRF